LLLQDSVNEVADAWESASATLAMAETRMQESITNFEQSSFKWTKTIGSIKAALTQARDNNIKTR
jgi:predicted trehalose synthase